jgi:uncharacterized protein (DUF2147 family)
MDMWSKAGAAAALMVAMQAPDALAQTALIEGVWLTPDGSEMTIAPCPAGYCGYITRIVVPDHLLRQYGNDIAAIGSSFTDAMNKDPALRARPIQNLQILSLSATDSPRRFEGFVYNPEDGNTYSGAVEAVSADRVRLKGCVLYVLCREQEWTRVALPARR